MKLNLFISLLFFINIFCISFAQSNACSSFTKVSPDLDRILQKSCKGETYKTLLNDFGITEKNWKNYGWDSPCDSTTMLGRVLIQLGIFKAMTSKDPADHVSNAYTYLTGRLRHLIPNCEGSFTAAVRDLRSNFGQVSNIQISKRFADFDDENKGGYAIIDNLSFLYHEARHTEGKYHRLIKCSGYPCDTSYDSKGAYAYQLDFLEDLVKNNLQLSCTNRDLARIQFNFIRDHNFKTKPKDKNIDSDYLSFCPNGNPPKSKDGDWKAFEERLF